MSTTNHNGSMTLTNFAELSSVLNPQTLPPVSEFTTDHAPNEEVSGDSQVTTSLKTDLAGLMAQLAHVSNGLETMAHHDACARDQAVLELAQYEAILAERQEAERALGEARRLRAAAEQLAADAFIDEARLQAAQHAAIARAAELSCTQLVAERARAAEDMTVRPHVARALADRRRQAQELAATTERARNERATRLASGLAAAREALDANHLDQATQIVGPLLREFPDDQQLRSRADALRWRLRQRQAEPAETALREVVRRPYRDDPEAAVARLAELRMDNLPEDLARRVFGLWSNACARVVQQRGWLEPHRYAPTTSRGVIFARPADGAPYQVVSALGLSDWRPGDEVRSERLVRVARELDLR